MIEKLETQITFTPYTIDTYCIFTFEDIESNIVENDNLEYDDCDWTYDSKGYVQALADNWLKLMQDNILDDVILDVELKGKAYSPREYNFTTDNADVIFTVDIDKLNQYIVDNRADYNENKIKSCDGFCYFGDEEDTMLHYYLHNESIENLDKNDYMMWQHEQVEAYEYITYKIIKK